MELLTYDIGKNVYAFSTLRHGGYSEGNYKSFNINEYSGDTLEHVNKNRQLLSSHLGITPDCIIIPHQIHKTEILEIGTEFINSSHKNQKALLEGKDALITSLKGYCICVSTADCIPIIIYDPKHHSSACIHAGWRGTSEKICIKALESMTKSFGTEPHDCNAIIGPGISMKNFEVGDEVYETFQSRGFPMEKISHKSSKWHIDLFESNHIQLEMSGISSNSIYVSNICTYDHSSDFFSARKLGIASGRILTGILLK